MSTVIVLCAHHLLVFQNFIEFYKLNGSKSSSFPVNKCVLPNDAPQRTLSQDGCLRVETGNQSNFIFKFHLNPEGGITGDTVCTMRCNAGSQHVARAA